MVVISEGLGIIDADTLPVREPHPMEAWAPEPGMPGEQRVSRVLPGGGHVTATRTALANWEAAEAQVRRNNVIVACERDRRPAAGRGEAPRGRAKAGRSLSRPRRGAPAGSRGCGRGRPLGAANRARPATDWRARYTSLREGRGEVEPARS
jgi:hypothetical protein